MLLQLTSQVSGSLKISKSVIWWLIKIILGFQKPVNYLCCQKRIRFVVFISIKHEKVFKRDEILEKVWGNDVIVGERTIDVHIRRLPRKIR